MKAIKEAAPEGLSRQIIKHKPLCGAAMLVAKTAIKKWLMCCAIVRACQERVLVLIFMSKGLHLYRRVQIDYIFILIYLNFCPDILNQKDIWERSSTG